eukprot:8099563-Lingulodinium_polyedra.AAC.1
MSRHRTATGCHRRCRFDCSSQIVEGVTDPPLPGGLPQCCRGYRTCVGKLPFPTGILTDSFATALAFAEHNL